ncbi:MAG TPA: PH domain-containing protein [Egibacteraceae bacterium]|nr:PH domain-containing protein [Egibacteraceae bacterium]
MSSWLRRVRSSASDAASTLGGVAAANAKGAASSVGDAVSRAGARVRGLGVDDDSDAELLDPLDPFSDPELEALDADEAPPDDAELGLDHFSELLRRLEPVPSLPLSEPFSTGLVPLLRHWAQEEGPGSFLADRRVLRVLGMVGDRFTITVSPDGITVRGLIRRRFAPWSRIQRLTFVDRYQMLREHALEAAVDDIVRRTAPIPGLRWLLRQVVGAIERRLPSSQRDALQQVGGCALQQIKRRGFDLELSSVLALVAFLSETLSDVAAAEAQLRGIPIEGLPSFETGLGV